MRRCPKTGVIENSVLFPSLGARGPRLIARFPSDQSEYFEGSRESELPRRATPRPAPSADGEGLISGPGRPRRAQHAINPRPIFSVLSTFPGAGSPSWGMTRKDASEDRDARPTAQPPEDLPQRTLPEVPAPTGDSMSAGEATGLLGGDASMTEANLALETQEGGDPAAGR